MLKAICVVSANDCCVAMAEYIAGSESAFVDMMNAKASELGMNDTTFKNCHGIDEDGHLTSAYDISLMSKELLNKYPEITNYTTIWMDSLRNGESELVNTNKLIRTYEGATGLKTGSTSLALYNLSASATRNNLSLIAVVMRAPSPTDRVSNAKTLLDYGFSNYEYLETSKSGTVVQSVQIQKGVQKEVNLVYEKTSGTVLKKGTSSNITTNITINKEITAPIKQGDILGKAEFYLNDELISSTNLVSEENIKKLNIGNMFERITQKWSELLR
jgi:D-alanyl-D-alanine carboxypeptidase (penicillin-binding protein 5/6)